MPYKRMPDLMPWLNERHRKLPKWAQEEISNLRAVEINADMGAGVDAQFRRMAMRVLGMNMTFSDDDMHLIVLLAEAAIDADLHHQIMDDTIKAKIEEAKERRHRAKRLGREAATEPFYEPFMGVLASLAAAISLLEGGGKAAKKAAPSDKMFDQMLIDYRNALETARKFILSYD